MTQHQQILLAFYGDDFTGSTDALEFIARAGANCLLFIEPPTAEQLQQYNGINVVGVAGATRSMSPKQMEETLMPAFQSLKALGAAQVHYKVCSTYDSSPMVGSIGKAMECGKAVFDPAVIPLLGGMPALGRYCVFGNLFARLGIGSDGNIFRLDRHPSMKHHPVTPSDESDLRMHLSRQTAMPIGHLSLLQMQRPVAEWSSRRNDDEEAILADALNDDDVFHFGEWLADLQNKDGRTVFSVGSSGIEMALGNYWNKAGILSPREEWTNPGSASALLVVSGSCSPVTATQIDWAQHHGFQLVELDLSEPTQTLAAVIQLLNEQTHVIVHTGNRKEVTLDASVTGAALGKLALEAVKICGISRVVVAGGDTSSYAARAMGIEAVEMLAPLVKGAPLCIAHSKDPAINGLAVNFKGGQVGPVNYFGIMQQGHL